MLVETTRFGQIEVSEENIIRLEPGLLGFDNINRYCLLEWKPGSPIKWLPFQEAVSINIIKAQ